ncbi:MAG: biopolymer transporter ExbD [Candidatus Margulisbacteria bacterium]|nr:biopolymer transporter ExbD [Candidatus Margulisiibacteriota bacterium]
MKSPQRRSYLKSIESTALTDIVFLLLIFFLLTSSFVNQVGVKVDLPDMQKPPVNKIQNPITIAVNNNLQVFLNDELVLEEEVVDKLTPMLVDMDDKLVVFRPDKSIQVEKLIAVMDLASLAGATKLVIATKAIED